MTRIAIACCVLCTIVTSYFAFVEVKRSAQAEEVKAAYASGVGDGFYQGLTRGLGACRAR